MPYFTITGDSLSYHTGNQFSTRHQDNDRHMGNCAQIYNGGWWYKDCHTANLNGMYLNGTTDITLSAKGVVWATWLGYDYSLLISEMKLRPIYEF